MFSIPLLSLSNVTIATADRSIVQGVNLTIERGEIHGLWGANGVGKSSLASLLVGHPAYHIGSGRVAWEGGDLLSLAPEERAAAGIFMTFQDPVTLPGVNNRQFVRTIIETDHKRRGVDMPSIAAQRTQMETARKAVDLPADIWRRAVNEDFSGGEKKRNELLQMMVMDPKLIIFDEIDSGLDGQARLLLIRLIGHLREQGKSILLITHYPDFLQAISPDYVHQIAGGKLTTCPGASWSVTQ